MPFCTLTHEIELALMGSDLTAEKVSFRAKLCPNRPNTKRDIKTGKNANLWLRRACCLQVPINSLPGQSNCYKERNDMCSLLSVGSCLLSKLLCDLNALSKEFGLSSGCNANCHS